MHRHNNKMLLISYSNRINSNHSNNKMQISFVSTKIFSKMPELLHKVNKSICSKSEESMETNCRFKVFHRQLKLTNNRISCNLISNNCKVVLAWLQTMPMQNFSNFKNLVNLVSSRICRTSKIFRVFCKAQKMLTVASNNFWIRIKLKIYNWIWLSKLKDLRDSVSCSCNNSRHNQVSSPFLNS